MAEDPSAHRYICDCCGERHDLPLDFAALAPQHWSDELAGRDDCELSDDLCTIEEHRFVRALLEIPVPDISVTFTWGIWSTLSQASFERVLELWDAPDREQEPAFFGWLATMLPEPFYGPTLDLPLHVHLSPGAQRPRVSVLDEHHPLAIDQRRGMTERRLYEIADLLAHGVAPKPRPRPSSSATRPGRVRWQRDAD